MNKTNHHTQNRSHRSDRKQPDNPASRRSPSTDQERTHAEQPKRPEVSFKAWPVEAAVWKNRIVRDDGGTFDAYSVAIERSYKTDDGWKKTTRFRVDDLPKVMLVAQKAFEHIVTAPPNKDD